MLTNEETQTRRRLAQAIGGGRITLDEFIALQRALPLREWRVVGTQANGFPIDKVVIAASASHAVLDCEMEGSFIVSVKLT